MCICRALFIGLHVIALSFGMSGCGKSQAHLSNDVYIWQRQWTPAVSTSIQRANSPVSIQAWRVLGGEVSSDGLLHQAHVSFDTLAVIKQPLILVIRIDGQLAKLDEAVLYAQISGILDNWRAHKLAIAGLEIDHDCGTQRLEAYTKFLEELRKRTATLKLSITALPDWINSPALSVLLEATDSYVLQVHAVQNPKGGLFDAQQATSWVNAFSKVSGKPFQVALPNYGSRVSWNERGEIVGIESEVPSATYAKESKELIAYPRTVQGFIQQLSQNSPKHLIGIAWFRLPVEGDRRTWDTATWYAVMNGRYVLSRVQAELRLDASGMYTVSLYNPSESDAELPKAVSLDRTCTLGDGANEYVLDEDGRRFTLQQIGLLHPYSRRTIGWLRCDNNKVVAHAEL